MLVKVIKKYYQDAGMPIPVISPSEILLLRKTIENVDTPLTLSEKV